MQAHFAMLSSNTALEASLTILLEDLYVEFDIHVNLVLQKIEKVITVNKGSSFSYRQQPLYLYLIGFL